MSDTQKMVQIVREMLGANSDVPIREILARISQTAECGAEMAKSGFVIRTIDIERRKAKAAIAQPNLQTFINIQVPTAQLAISLSWRLLMEWGCCHTWEPLPGGFWEVRVRPERVNDVKKWLKEHGCGEQP